MSAYIVEDKTINKIVAFLADQQDSGEIGSISFYGIPSWVPLTSDEAKAELAQALFDMNVESIEQRYGEGQAKTFRPLDFKYQRVFPPIAIDAYKSLGCYLYQSCEGNVDETNLYKMMEKISNRIAHSILQSSKAWEDTPWG